MELRTKETLLRIDELETALKKLPELVKAAKDYDGKVFTKRFETAVLEKVGCYMFYHSDTSYSPEKKRNVKTGSLSIVFPRDKRPSVDVLQSHDTCRNGIVDYNESKDNLRFNFEGFKAFAEKKTQMYTDMLVKLRDDIEHGQEKLQEYNELAERLKELYKGFSKEFREENRYDFKIIP